MNGMQIKIQALALGAVLVASSWTVGAVIHVPADYRTIPKAIAVARPGDTILIARGTYTLDSLNVPKTLVLASEYVDSKDEADIDNTIIKASARAGKGWFDVRPSAKDTKIIGLTLEGNRNHTLAIRNSYTEVQHCKFIKGKDQLSFEGGGGLVSHCYFEGSGDEPIDADESVSWTVEYCTFQGSGQDGLEVRLHPKGAPPTSHVVRYNTFVGIRANCVQLVDYEGDSHREFHIYGNIFKSAGGRGVDCTLDSSDGNLNGSPMLERVVVYNNTFDGCGSGITMAPGVAVLNNLFTNTRRQAIIKGQYLKSKSSAVVDYCLFFQNASDYEDGLRLGKHNILNRDPQYRDTSSYRLSSASPAIDKGVTNYEWHGVNLLEIAQERYSGMAPDLGAKENEMQ